MTAYSYEDAFFATESATSPILPGDLLEVRVGGDAAQLPAELPGSLPGALLLVPQAHEQLLLVQPPLAS